MARSDGGRISCYFNSLPRSSISIRCISHPKVVLKRCREIARSAPSRTEGMSRTKN
jgi:hypothetical protein